MKPFGRANVHQSPFKDFGDFWRRSRKVLEAEGCDRAKARSLYKQHIANDDYEIYVNGTFQVSVKRDCEHGFGGDVRVDELSVKRSDKGDNITWRDLQTIKNMICGPEAEAVELFPAEARLMDTANQRWLYVVKSSDNYIGWPIGHAGRFVANSEQAAALGARQTEGECTACGGTGFVTAAMEGPGFDKCGYCGGES